MRIPAALAFLFFLGTFAPPGLYAPLPIPADPRVRFDPVALSGAEPGQRRVGRLEYLGGWRLRSNDPRFGGLSAIHVDGGNVVAVSDAGSVIAFPLPGSGRSASVRIRPLVDGPGPSSRKSNRDAEALAVAGGAAWIAFENRNAIWRYSTGHWRGEAGARPEAMRNWHDNRGSEAMVRLNDGRFLVFAEGGLRADGTSEALLFGGDPSEKSAGAVPLRYKAPGGYRITDAATLADGRLLFLNRRMDWPGRFAAKLTLGPPLRGEAGEVLTGRAIASFEPPLAVDNMEALSVVRESGRTILWMASDDNFSPLQRTLLLKFALDDPARP